MKTAAVFVADPYCSVQSANGLIRVLSQDFHIRIFGPRPVEDGFFDSCDLICVPGGLGDSEQFSRLMLHHSEPIQRRVREGGYYLGVCMGAYWAGKYYLDLLREVTVEQYIKRPNTCTRRPHAKAMPVTWQGSDIRMYFYDGCAFVGSDMDCVATYSNGDAMAIIQGRVGAIGCHPESESDWYLYHSWMNNHFHGGRDWQLLRQFVQRLTM